MAEQEIKIKHRNDCPLRTKIPMDDSYTFECNINEINCEQYNDPNAFPLDCPIIDNTYSIRKDNE